MSLSSKRESLARIQGRYQRAGRPHKTRIHDEFCATCGYHRKAALRLLNTPLRTTPPKRSGPKLLYEPAQIDRLLRPARVQHPMKGLSTTRPGSVEADTVAHCDDSTEGDYVNSLTFTELYSGWTENRAVWNKSAEAVLVQLQELERVVTYEMKNFHTDNGGRVPQLGALPASDGPAGEAALDAEPGVSQERQRALRAEELDACAAIPRWWG